MKHFKEILVHLKPNNFPRYLEQLNEIESIITSIDATKFSYKDFMEVKRVIEHEEVVVNDIVDVNAEQAEQAVPADNKVEEVNESEEQ